MNEKEIRKHGRLGQNHEKRLTKIKQTKIIARKVFPDKSGQTVFIN